MQDLSFFSNITIVPNLNSISNMICSLLAVSAGHFWQPAKLENVSHPDSGNIFHLKNLGPLFITKLFIKGLLPPYTQLLFIISLSCYWFGILNQLNFVVCFFPLEYEW